MAPWTNVADINQTKFVAFNVEPEEYSEDELDDTKEIQVWYCFNFKFDLI
jgi:hypothetical protein